MSPGAVNKSRIEGNAPHTPMQHRTAVVASKDRDPSPQPGSPASQARSESAQGDGGVSAEEINLNIFNDDDEGEDQELGEEEEQENAGIEAGSEKDASRKGEMLKRKGRKLWESALQSGKADLKKAEAKTAEKQKRKEKESVGAPHQYSPFSSAHQRAVRDMVLAHVEAVNDYSAEHNLNPTTVWGHANGDLPNYSNTPWQAFLKCRGTYRTVKEGKSEINSFLIHSYYLNW